MPHDAVFEVYSYAQFVAQYKAGCSSLRKVVARLPKKIDREPWHQNWEEKERTYVKDWNMFKRRI